MYAELSKNLNIKHSYVIQFEKASARDMYKRCVVHIVTCACGVKCVYMQICCVFTHISCSFALHQNISEEWGVSFQLQARDCDDMCEYARVRVHIKYTRFNVQIHLCTYSDVSDCNF